MAERVNKILVEKETKLDQIRKEKVKVEEDEEMKECTFAPVYHSLQNPKEPA